MNDIILGLALLLGVICFFSAIPAMVLIALLVKKNIMLSKHEMITIGCIILVFTLIGSVFLPYYFANKELYQLADKSSYGGIGFLFMMTGGLLAFVCNVFVLGYAILKREKPIQIVTVMAITNVIIYVPHILLGSRIYMHVISKLPIK